MMTSVYVIRRRERKGRSETLEACETQMIAETRMEYFRQYFSPQDSIFVVEVPFHADIQHDFPQM